MTAAEDRGAQIGVMLAAAFGVVWTLWGASGLDRAASGAIQVFGIVVGLAIVVATIRLRSGTHRLRSAVDVAPVGQARSMFASRSYLIVVVVEVVAIGVGNRLLAATGHSDYVIAWVAIVIGTHFLALARLFFPGFYWLGGALIAAGLIGITVGGVGGGAASITAASGLTAAASLFGSGAWAMIGQFRARRIAVEALPV
jgi:hypothetical protein